MSTDMLSSVLAMEKFTPVREDLNRARHLIRKSATELNCSPDDLIKIVRDDSQIKLFGIDSFPL